MADQRERSVSARAGRGGEAQAGFVGRSTEVKQLAELLLDGRQLTLCGAPGVGKSRLAREVVRVAGGHFDAVTWVGFGPRHGAASIARTVLGALGAAPARGRPDKAVIDHLRAGRHLLVLDTCEHVIDGCAAFAHETLRACPELTVLATSREPLAIDGERRWRVPPLSIADSAELFQLRLSGHRFDVITDETAAAIVDICTELEGIPLAIELAATRAREIEPADLAALLAADVLGTLSGGTGRRFPARHRSLSATFDWTYALLSGSERAVLRRLSVFAGGCTLDAARAVTAAGEVTTGEVFEVMASLVARSVVVAHTTGREGRYSLPRTLRPYARERLDEAGEADETTARHWSWCARLVEGAEPELTGPRQLDVLNRLDAERENLRLGVAWGVSQGCPEALRVAAGASLWWWIRGRAEEGLVAIRTALDSHVDAPADWRAWGLWGAGLLTWTLGDGATAASLVGTSLDLARDAGWVRGEARALLLLGTIGPPHGGASLPQLRTAASLAAADGDDWCHAHALAVQGMAEARAGRTVSAVALVDESLGLARAGGDLQSERLALLARSRLHVRLGEATQAEATAAEALTVTRRLGDAVGTADGLVALGEAHLWLGRYGAAEASCRAALDVAGPASPAVTAAARCGLGRIAAARGAGDSARAMYELVVAEPAAPPASLIRALTGLATLQVAVGDLVAARALGHRATQVATGLGDPQELASVASAQAELAEAEGDPAAALALRRRALGQAAGGAADAADAGDPRVVAESIEAVARGIAGSRKAGDAVRLIGAAEAMRRARGCPRHPVDESPAAALRRGLGDEDFEAAWAEGLAMTAEEAVGLGTTGRRKRPSKGWPSLTGAEQEVVLLMAEGCSNREIAGRLYVSRNTVQTHVSHIFAKLGVSSRAHVAREAALRGTVGGRVVDAARPSRQPTPEAGC